MSSDRASEPAGVPTKCPRCEGEGERHEIAVRLTRWTDTALETTLRCAHCGWQDTRTEPPPA